MNKHTSIHQHRTTMLSAALVLLMICDLLTFLAPNATAAVTIWSTSERMPAATT